MVTSSLTERRAWEWRGESVMASSALQKSSALQLEMFTASGSLRIVCIVHRMPDVVGIFNPHSRNAQQKG